MTINLNKLARRVAVANLIALGTASAGAAQPLVNPAAPPITGPAAATPASQDNTPTNYFRPRVGIQAAATDNVTSVTSNRQSDVLLRATVGADAGYESPRTKANISADVLYEVYSKYDEYNAFNYSGTADARYVVVPQLLALEAAGARTQGSLTSFGTTDFFRTSAADDYQVTTYYVGPHVTFSPGRFDVSAAARYAQVFYDGPADDGIQTLSPETSIYQVIGAADTGDRWGRTRFVASGQHQRDDNDFEITSGSVSGFYQATPRLTLIARAGYDSTQLTNVSNIDAPFWSIGGKFIFNDRANVRFEGGQRYDEPYWSGSASVHFANIFYFIADYSRTLAPGPVTISNVLVERVGGLDQTLPLPIAQPAFRLSSNYFDEPSINSTGSAQLLVDLDRQSLALQFTSVQQEFLTTPGENLTLSQAVTYTNNFRPDLTLSLRFLYATERLTGQMLPSTQDGEGDYYLTTAKAEYQLNRRSSLVAMYQNRHFEPDSTGLLQQYDENIISLAFIRQLW